MTYEQRKYRRIKTHIVVDVETPGAPPEKVEATCLDLSVGGMKVLLPMCLEVGQQAVVVCLLDRRLDGKFFLEEKVSIARVESTSSPDDFIIGLSFDGLRLETEQEITNLTGD